MFNWTFTVGNVIEICVIAAGGLWTLVTMRFNLRLLRHDLSNLKQRQQALSELLTVENTKLEGDIAGLRSEAGEMGMALRQKVTEVELHMRDHFVRRDTFGPLVTKLEGEINGVGDKLEARLLRIENKLDAKA